MTAGKSANTTRVQFVAISECIRHAGGTMVEWRARHGQIPATARTHNPARGPQQPQGPTCVPARMCAAREDELAGGPMTDGGASGRGSAPTGAGGLALAAGTGRGDATSTCKCL